MKTAAGLMVGGCAILYADAGIVPYARQKWTIRRKTLAFEAPFAYNFIKKIQK